jgi:hypothetical protein
MNKRKSDGITFLTTICSIVISYYVAVILHEWGHGTVAWLCGAKKAFWDVTYGGWLLLHVDENVPYDALLANHKGACAAFTGIAGVLVSITLLLLSLVAVKKIKKSIRLYSFFYWFSVINMIPLIQYLTIQTFSIQGDVGRFTHGLNISPWWVFIPGTALVIFALYRLCRYAIPKAYTILQIKAIWVQRLFLFTSLGLMFLLIYLGAYNPLSDPGMPLIGKVAAVISMLLVPVLFFVCNPSRKWVKKLL